MLPGIGEIRAGDDLAAVILAADAAAADAAGSAGSVLADGDILAVTSKIVSKAEGRQVAASDREQAITDETVRVVATRVHPGGVTRIVQNRQGLVMAAAGVDASNVAEGTVLLLPADPDASARALCAALRASTGLRLGLLITDTAGRPWRDGQTDIAIGAAGMAVLDDLRGSADAHGRRLDVTVAAVADEIAGAADLIKGKTSGNPVAVLRGLGHLVAAIDEGDRGARRLLRDSAQDMFRVGSAEAYAEGYAAGVAAGAASAAAASVAAASAAPADTSGKTQAAEDGAAELPGKAPSGAPKGETAASRENPAAELPQDAPSAPAKVDVAATRESASAELLQDAPSAPAKGDVAATREAAEAELPVEAPSAPANGPEVATRGSFAAELPVAAPSGVAKGPEVASRGSSIL